MTNILQNAGEYEILTPIADLKEQLKMIEKAGRTCYQSEKGSITDESADKFVRRLIARGHLSQLEYGRLVVKFKNCSRGNSHEIVRHRLASFSQESTRYVDESDSSFVMPPDKNIDEAFLVKLKHTDLTYDKESEVLVSPKQMAEFIYRYYGVLKNEGGWTSEDARQFLPIGTTSEIVIGTNFRHWIDIFSLRCERHAHWEIRSVMSKLLEEMKEHVPAVFSQFQVVGYDKKKIPYYEIDMTSV